MNARRSFVARRLPADAESNAGESRTPAAVSHADAASLKLMDLSLHPRWGLKGRNTFAWLAAKGATIPNLDSTAQPQPDGSSVVRLSPSEALILSLSGDRPRLADALDLLPAQGFDSCYPVPRSDSHCWFLLCGNQTPDVLAKLCGIDFAPARFVNWRVAQTNIAGLSAIAIRDDMAGSLAFSLLAENTGAEYLWDCIVDAMTEFGGVICAADTLNGSGDG
jgi:sarcosine oxidase subunit gamma